MSGTAPEPSLPRLTAAETATRLGVKPATLYAYVSRGLLGRRRSADGSSFDPLEVEAFAAARRGSGQPAPTTTRPASGSPLMTIESDLALLEDDQLYYRGTPVEELVDELFEAVSTWVWTGARDARLPFVVPAEAAERGARLLPRSGDVDPTPALDRLHLHLVVAAGADPLRNELDAETLTRQAASVLAVLVDAAGPRRRSDGDRWEPNSDHGQRLAERLFVRLSPERLRADRVAVLNAALVLLLDHDLAASTMAVRVAASARANLYAAVSSGLGALDSALHGNASRAAYRVLGRVLGGETVELVLAETVAETGAAPGFGHRVYGRRDPRAVALIDRLGGLPEAAPVLSALRAIEAAVQRRRPTFVNIDLALAAMAHTFGMDADAGTVVFAVGRTSGWVSHILQEYREPPLRLRPVGRYVGP